MVPFVLTDNVRESQVQPDLVQGHETWEALYCSSSLRLFHVAFVKYQVGWEKGTECLLSYSVPRLLTNHEGKEGSETPTEWPKIKTEGDGMQRKRT